MKIDRPTILNSVIIYTLNLSVCSAGARVGGPKIQLRGPVLIFKRKYLQKFENIKK